jgi:hypothetical protein
MPHGPKPQSKRLSATVKYGPGRHRSLHPALSTTVQASNRNPKGSRLAPRTNKAIGPAQIVKIPQTVGFRAESAFKFHQVAGVIFFHTSIYYILWLLESSAYPRKIKTVFSSIHIICGLSNIFYWLPNGKFINQTFISIAFAITKRLDGVILNLLDNRMMANIITAEALLGHNFYYTK